MMNDNNTTSSAQIHLVGSTKYLKLVFNKIIAVIPLSKISGVYLYKNFVVLVLDNHFLLDTLTEVLEYSFISEISENQISLEFHKDTPISADLIKIFGLN